MDPKSIVCEFYRHGQCTKGFKCKFSHDLNVEKKVRASGGMRVRACWGGPVHAGVRVLEWPSARAKLPRHCCNAPKAWIRATSRA